MTARDQRLLGVVLVAILAVAGWFILVQPKHAEASHLQTQIASTQSELSQAEAQVQAGVSAEGQARTLRAQLAGVSRAVPSDAQIPELINQLQAAASRNQVGFDSVAVTTVTSAGGTAVASFPNQGFNLSFTGDYFKVADLLGTLNRFVRADNRHFAASGRLIDISSVGLTPKSDANAQGDASGGRVTAAVTAVDYDIPSGLSSAPGAGTASLAGSAPPSTSVSTH